MFKFLGWIFGRKDTPECQSDSNHESEILAKSYVDKSDATKNQNYPYSDFHQLHTSYELSWNTHFQSRDKMFNCSSSSNVSSKFKDRSSTSLASNIQEAVVVSSSSDSKFKKIIVDSDSKPNTRVGTFENAKIDQELRSKPRLHLSLDSSSVSSELPLHPSTPPPPKLCSFPPPSLFGTTSNSSKHPPVCNNPTSFSAKSKSTDEQTKANSVWVNKGASPRSLASEDGKSSIKTNNLPGLPEKPPSPPSSSYPSSYETHPSSPKFSPIFRPISSSNSCSSTTQQNKTKYIWVEKGALPLYTVPEDIKDLIKRDIVPEVLKKPLSPLTYKDYFAALLYSEDYYIEKWDGFEMEEVSMEVKMKNVSLELHRAEIHRRNGKSKNLYGSDDNENKTFVQFEMESIPEKRPFLLSKDFAYVRPSDTDDTPFKGVIYRIEKSKHILVEFGKAFYDQHYPECKYDVKFSLNRVCLKRAHRAIEAASDLVFRNFLFPSIIPRSNNVSLEELHPLHLTLNREQICAVKRIVMHQRPFPYLMEGPLSVSRLRNKLVSNATLTSTGKVIQVAVLQLLRISPLNRILICAPSNSACDALMVNLQKEIPMSDMFRSNAAFRGLDEVPGDILPHCPYEEEKELFPCPPLSELQNFRLIFSTFMSTFRLHHEGLKAGHFSHIFLVDASSAIEPETLVPLSNLANEKTVVVVTGKPGDCSRWVRSKIARNNGLRKSYFERLRTSELYMTLDPQVISQLSLTD